MLISLFPDQLNVLVILIPTLVFSLCFHEFAHGYIAYRLGDHTAARNGRLTLNPLAHLDLMGSLMILFVGFGWAKPVPVNPANFHNPRRDMMKVAFAGPASNLLLAFIAGLIIRYNLLGIDNTAIINQILNTSILMIILQFFMYINIMLAVFNMLPIAPLDGSQIFGNLISKNNADLAWKLQVNGPKFLIAIVILSMFTSRIYGFSIFGLIIKPFHSFFFFLFAGI